MSQMGRALMGTGIAKGANRARMAAEMAVASPLLDDISVDGAMGVLINIVGGPDLKMREIQEAASLVQEQAHEDANIIFGASIDETLGENVKVTVIATGFDSDAQHAHQEAAARQQAQVSSSTMSSMQRPVYSSGTPSARNSEIPALSTRRVAHAQDARSSAPPSSAQGRLPMRERLQTSNFPTDTEWDVPAFQRKGQ